MQFHALTLITAFMGLATLAVASPATAEPQPQAVIELFTSQGCSSCPPADETLAALAREPGIIALSYHVDYWNYLGWADTLASRENTARQYDYAKTFRRSGVYTPQVVINGRAEMPGQSQGGIRQAVGKLNGRQQGLTIPIAAKLTGSSLSIDLPDGPGKAEVLVVAYQPSATVEINRGENRGRTVTYANSVTKIYQVGSWTGKAAHLSAKLEVSQAKGTGYAVLLQRHAGKHGSVATPGAILGAALVSPSP